ncbi:universal stress protein [Methylocella sp.]|jgi:nucleotide-binding universal stress UspA family protein|uniref:universal stress protein n=1 Tax=Methylocella sp. TaxID=1978226 RepID=UPI003C216B26
MYSNILIPTDGSVLSGEALKHAVDLAKAIGAKVTVLTVTAPLQVYSAEVALIEEPPADFQARITEHAERVLAEAAAVAKAGGVTVETVKVEADRPYEEIIGTASAKGCDLIVMASHGRKGVAALVLGSETQKVLTHCKIPVLVHR